MRIFFLFLFAGYQLMSVAQSDSEFQIFQFPPDQIPRIDGDFSDWEMVPDSYSIGLDKLMDTRFGRGTDLDPKDYDIDVKVGWVNGFSRLYFYVQAWDDYWDFDEPGLWQDIFEIVVDADLSGGPFIKSRNSNISRLSKEELHFKGHGAHAQNYHIFTPVQNKDWAMIWGNTPWIKDFPHANAAYHYDFQAGDSGPLKMEFWITPFDHASHKGFHQSVVSELKENDLIGLSWCILEHDGEEMEAFINLAHDTRMVFDASYLPTFRLMPLDQQYRAPVQANWSFTEMDRDQRWIQFKDESIGKINSWHWDFGDGHSSTEQHPLHRYEKGGEWTVILRVEGPEGKSTRSKVWDVVTK